jgi:maleylpyruvate isomerase
LTPRSNYTYVVISGITKIWPVAVLGALNWLTGATERLTGSIEDVRSEDLEQTSLLPGWSRSHVLVHLARNADGLRNLLLSARTGEPLRMYASPQTREADIVAGVTRPAEVIIADVVEASRRFLVEAAAFPEDRWTNEVTFTSGGPNPLPISAERVVELRLAEVEIHHVDLDLGYSFGDVPAFLAGQLLADFVCRYDQQSTRFALELDDHPGGVGCVRSGDLPVVRGSLADALAWLTGRSSEGMRCTSGGPLPELPPFG